LFVIGHTLHQQHGREAAAHGTLPYSCDFDNNPLSLTYSPSLFLGQRGRCPARRRRPCANA